MQSLRGHGGYTLLEATVVVAVVGTLAVMAIAALRGYNRREDTRTAARSLAGIFERARDEARTTGRMTWLVFSEPVNGVAPFADPAQFAALIYDTDNDLQPTLADDVTPISLPTGVRDHTFKFDTGGASPYTAAALPDADQSRDIPVGNLVNTVDGSTLNVDVVLGVPTVGFSSQGFPVKAGTPLDPGSGAGGMYMTDNDSQVVAVLVLPLGEVRTLAYVSASGSWR